MMASMLALLGILMIVGLPLLSSEALAEEERTIESPAAAQELKQACELPKGEESAALDVVPPLTLRLADGRFVHLAEIFAPARQGGFDPSAAAASAIKKF